MSYFDDASLVMIPSGYKDQKVYSVKPLDGSGDLTFSRASSATRVASNGLIEKVRTNLLQQSQNFAAAAWSLIGTATRTANYGIAPDGTQTSTRIQWTSAAGFEIYQYTGVAAPVYGSVYIKGTAGQTIRYSGNDVTLNGSWQRIEGGLAIDGSNTYFTIVGNTVSNTAFDFQLWGAQAEAGDIATAYIPTTTAAVSVGPVSGLPRLDYLNSSCPRLLLEPQRSSLITYSEQMDNAVWTKFSPTSVTANTAVSPDGYTNADTVSTSGTAVVRQSIALSANTVYTYSVFAKKKAYNLFGIQTLISGAGIKSVFNLNTGVVTTQGSGHTASIVNYGNGWYRCIVTFNCGSSTSNIFDLSTDTGSGDLQEYYCYGAMAEAGAYATSYIPTLGTSVTRVTDAASKTGISSLIGSTAGTVFFEGVYDSVNTTSTRFVSLKGAGTTYQNLFIIQDNQNGTFNVSFVDSSVSLLVDITWTHGLTNGQSFKLAVAYTNNDVVVYQNGVSKGTDTSYTPITFTDFYLQYPDVLGKTQTKQALLFKNRLSNSDLAALTA